MIEYVHWATQELVAVIPYLAPVVSQSLRQVTGYHMPVSFHCPWGKIWTWRRHNIML